VKIKRINPSLSELPVTFEYFMELNDLTLVIKSNHTGSVDDKEFDAFEVFIQNKNNQYAKLNADYTLITNGPTEYLAIKELVERTSSKILYFRGFWRVKSLKVPRLFSYENV